MKINGKKIRNFILFFLIFLMGYNLFEWISYQLFNTTLSDVVKNLIENYV